MLEHVGINPTRTGVIDILKDGADLTLETRRSRRRARRGHSRARGQAQGYRHIPEDLVPLAIDEFPVLFVAAACAEGRTALRGAEELRVKESDRIQVMADGLIALGVKAEPTPDGIIIEGGLIGGGEVWSHAITVSLRPKAASLRHGTDPVVQDCANVATSFPNSVCRWRRYPRGGGGQMSAVVITIDGPMARARVPSLACWLPSSAGSCWIPAYAIACWPLPPVITVSI